MSEQTIKIFDAADMVVGRLATKAAKAALYGDRVVIVNAEKAVITGHKREVIDEWKARATIHTSSNPRRGPFHERRPDMMVRRMIRGMLPWPRPRGKEAMRRIHVYIGVPEEYADKEKIVLEDSRYRSLTRKFITVGDLSYELGWRNPEVA